MPLFCKKPIVIEAVQWFKHGDHPEVKRVPLGTELPKQEGKIWDQWVETTGWIETLEGGHIVSPGDWIIKGIKGEFYPCKDDIFKMTYEEIE